MDYLEAQDRVHKWISSTKLGYFPPLGMLAALIEESGEIAKAMEEQNESELEKEINDLVFPIICLANSHDIKLNEVRLKTATQEPYLRLQQHIGEVAREINHMYGVKKKKTTEETEGLSFELNQAMACVNELSKKYSVDLKEGFEVLMNKFDTRDKDRWERK